MLLSTYRPVSRREDSYIKYKVEVVGVYLRIHEAVQDRDEDSL